jgi:alkylation response protein AidB-like acyl-CoA dehydrogenase
LLADIRKLAGTITSRAAEIEACRRMPPDLVEALKTLGVFRMLVPKSHGGLELDLPEALEAIRTLSRIDGSTGWTAMIGGAGGLITPLLLRETYEKVYQNGPNAIIAGSVQPKGTADVIDGGWRVSGRWGFASGCQHADWMFGFCVMSKDGGPLPGPADEEDRQLVRGFFLPAHEWLIEDTWYVAGLKGTGSHHIAVSDKLVPEAYFFDFPRGTPCLSGPLYQSLPHLISLLHSAVCVGIAEGSLDELIELANTGHRQAGAAAPMRESEMFQFELGRIAAEVRAARAFHQVQVADHWSRALAGKLYDEGLSAQGTQAAIWIADRCVHAADACFTLGGGSALYDASPLQRRLRDLHAAAQHAAAHQWKYVTAGRFLLGRCSGRNSEV